MSEYAQELINNAPPLDEDKRARLAAILQEVNMSEQHHVAA